MKQIYNIMVGMALMLGATSCEEEILDNGQAAGIALADGQFIVDYSGEVTTRAIKDNAAKGERINSLTYLLYKKQENDYVLEKRREIPGLNKKDDAGNPVYESWPLTRDNMTWEQREALKDTLLVSSNYRAVFVANADASLWDGTNSPLVGADLPTNGSAAPSYSSAYLQLPEDLAFNDGNMFYLAEAEINGAGQNRETPYNCPIMLKRVVTRTDWWFERLPEFTVDSENPDGWKDGEEVKAYSTAMLNSGSEVYWASIINSINAVTESFLSEMITYFDTKGENQEDPEAESYNNYATALTTMKEDLSSSNYAIDVLNAEDGKLFADFFEMLRVACLGNQEIQQRWIASWRKDVYSAQLVYDGTGQRADRLYLDKTTSHEGTTNVSPLMSIDSQEENTLDGYTYDGFHFVGLANPELNQVSQVIISDANNAETTINVSATVHTEQGINERYGIYYRPIAELGLKDDWNNSGTTDVIIPKEITCDLATALPFAEDGSQNVLKEAMTEAMTDETATDLQKYGESLNSITLTISLPNLENTAVLKITDSWNMRKID